MAAMTAVAAVAAQVHQDHAADQAGVEHRRRGQNTEDDEGDRHETDREPGHEPSRSGRGEHRRARCVRSLALLSDGFGGMLVRGRHDRLSSIVNVALAPCACRAVMKRTMPRTAMPSPRTCAVLSPNSTAGSSRRKKSANRIDWKSG